MINVTPSSAWRSVSRAWLAARAEMAHPGETDLSGHAIWRIGRVAITAMIVVTNLLGAVSVLAISLLVVPEPRITHPGRVELLNGLLALVYVGVAVPAGVRIGTRRLLSIREWLVEGRDATPVEALTVLRAPLRLFGLQLSLWFGAAVLFGFTNALFSLALGLRVAVTVAITGTVTGACAYLLSDLMFRPTAARAISTRLPGPLIVPGIATRSVLAWLFGALPVVAMMSVGVETLAGDPSATRSQLAIVMTVLGGVSLSVGLIVTTAVARATADPVKSVGHALARVQRGEANVRVAVYDGTEIGQLQIGFNDMAIGLAERDRIRSALGIYLDPVIAERIIRDGTDLRGEQVEVTVMFIDVRGFTAYADHTEAADVFAALNELFTQFVDVVHRHGGRVDKFLGDGLLAVWGAPRRHPDHADRALTAAVEIAHDARSSVGFTFGIGLNTGHVIAGSLGGAGRYEFGVIGDTVNMASRIEAATRQTGDPLLISQQTCDALQNRPSLVRRDGVTLKGKPGTTSLYAVLRPTSASGCGVATDNGR